jgi:dolichol-phosphate mannosyltransferase
MSKYSLSIIIPVFNEEENILSIYTAISKEWQKVLSQKYNFEIIFVDDGSCDNSIKEIKKIQQKKDNVHFIEFSRNFGKEIATTAGLHSCKGEACIMIDADLQHPVEILSEFIKKWEKSFEVVIGVRNESKSDGFVKRFGSVLFYKLMNVISDVPIIPRATDYRLLDRKVIDSFNALPERNRMTRGLIDWLGFKRTTIDFDANERQNGEASYSTIKLFRLAFTSIISMSMLPLRITGYLGIFIVIVSSILGLVMFLDRYIFAWGLSFTGTAFLADMILFLIGVVLISLGLLAFYIADIYHESQGRPMYIIRNKK